MAADVHDTLQRLVDELAERIGRPVDVEDRDLRVLAYSAHEHEVDAVRSRSILARSGPREVDAWLRSRGVHGATGPVRLPANPDLGMAARLCVPIRDGRSLLGFLWLVDEPGRPVGDDEVAAAADTATACAVVLRAMRAAEDEDRATARLLAGAALRGDASAAQRLVTEGLLVPTAAITVAAVDATGGEAAGALRRVLPSGHAIDLTGDDGTLVLVLTLPAGTDPDALAARLADRAAAVTGLGTPRPDLRGLPACLREARAAALVARRVPGHGASASFAATGTDGRLALLPAADLEQLTAAPALERLAAQDPDGALRTTLLTWLDHGGDATGAAAALSLHRATLYHRLHRIAELAEVRLDDGDARLGLHLGLRAARLLGR